jgi:uncharacterized Fe-S cluster protein YjdI
MRRRICRLQNLAAVFKPNERPWVILDGADADEIARVVMTCPTGATTLSTCSEGFSP